MTGERTTETYSWTVSSEAEKVNSVKGAEGVKGGRKSAVSGCGVWVWCLGGGAQYRHLSDKKTCI